MPRPSARWAGVAILPAGVVLFHVLRISIDNGVSPFSTIRPVLAGLAVAVLLAWIASFATADRGKAILLATFGTFAVIVWPVLRELLIAALAVLVVVVVLPRLLRTPFPWRLVPRATTALALVLVFAVLIRAVETGVAAQLPRDLHWALRGATHQAAGGSSSDPDIYLLMLEDYPRADVLARVFGIDNGSFVAGLEQRGFAVAPKARSSYSNTAFSLLTMFQARHVDELRELDPLRGSPDRARYPVIRALINDGAPLEMLRQRGYEIVAADPGYEQLTLRSADRLFEPSQTTDLEWTLLTTTVAAPAADALLPGFLGQQVRDRVEAEFRFLGDVASEPSGHPKFVFVHVPSPHLPVVFGPNGEPVDVPLLGPKFAQLAHPATFASVYGGQISYIDRLTLAAVDRIAATGRPSLVLVTSDEGMGHVMMSATSGDPADAVRFLFAARSPSGEDLFGPDITSVNIFPAIFERLFGGGLARRSDRVFVSPETSPFEGVELGEIDG